MKTTEALNDDGGDLAVGRIGPIACAATTAAGHNALATLVRREDETLNDLLARRHEASARFCETDKTIDEINPPIY
ncbi:MAG: hypothetical protein H7337_20055 [Rhizobacter sp.]|nr:hypothetical protein [Rhizobacter sp.]